MLTGGYLFGSECLHFALDNPRFISDLGVPAALVVVGSYGVFATAIAVVAAPLSRWRFAPIVLISGAYFLLTSLQLFWVRAKILNNPALIATFLIFGIGLFTGVYFAARRLRLHVGAPVLFVAVYYNLGRSLADDWSSRGGNLVAFVTARETVLKSLAAAVVLAAVVWIPTRWPRIAIRMHATFLIAFAMAVALISQRVRVPDTDDVRIAASETRPDIFVLSFDAMRIDALSSYVHAHPDGRLGELWTSGQHFKNIVSDGLATYSILSNNTRGGVDRKDCTDALPAMLAKHGYHTSMFLGRYAQRIDAAGCYDRYYAGTGRPLAELFVPLAVAYALVGDAGEMRLRRNFIPSSELVKEVRLMAAQRPHQPLFSYIHFLDLHAPYISTARADDDDYLVALRRYMANCYAVACDPSVPENQRLISDVRSVYGETFVDIDGLLDGFFDMLAVRGRPYVVILTADHGELFGEHGGFAHSGGFVKELLNVPFIVYDSVGGSEHLVPHCELMLSSEALPIVIKRKLDLTQVAYPDHKKVVVERTALGSAIVNRENESVEFQIRPSRMAHQGTARNIHHRQAGSLPYPMRDCP